VILYDVNLTGDGAHLAILLMLIVLVVLALVGRFVR